MSACLVCGAEPCDRHHVTGRDGADRYLDPDFVFPLCHDDHEQQHDDWRTQGLCDVPVRLSFVERIEVRLRRLATFAGRIAEAHPEWTWASILARTLSIWADDARADIQARTARDPEWREDPRFYPNTGDAS